MHLPYIIKVIFFQCRCIHSRSRLIVLGTHCSLVRQQQDGRGLRVGRSEQVASGSATRDLGGELVQPPTSQVRKMRSRSDFPHFTQLEHGLGVQAFQLFPFDSRSPSFPSLLSSLPQSSWIPLGPYISLRAAFPYVWKLSLKGVDCASPHAFLWLHWSPGKQRLQGLSPSFTDEPTAVVEREVLEYCQLLLPSCLKIETFNSEVATQILGSLNKL